MRIPVSWLVEHLGFDEVPTPDELAEAFTRIGIEVEEVSPLGPVTGPIVAGRVVAIEELTEFKKPIRYCQVEVGPEQVNNIICGATNFVEGDSVVVALPGAVLPGDFTIAERKTYGRVSQGMICAADCLLQMRVSTPSLRLTCSSTWIRLGEPGCCANVTAC